MKMKELKELFTGRLSNYAFWTSLFALIPIIGQMFGLFTLPDEYASLCNTLLAFLVAAGLVNNPTTKAKWYYDDCDHEGSEHNENCKKIER